MNIKHYIDDVNKKYGETTKDFLVFLKLNGPTTIKSLEKLPFWGGVRGRIAILIKQHRIERIDIPNENNYHHSRSVSAGLKLVDGADIGPVKRAKRVEQTYDERIRLERRNRAIENAISLLVQNGYKVVPPNAEQDTTNEK